MYIRDKARARERKKERERDERRQRTYANTHARTYAQLYDQTCVSVYTFSHQTQHTEMVRGDVSSPYSVCKNVYVSGYRVSLNVKKASNIDIDIAY